MANGCKADAPKTSDWDDNKTNEASPQCTFHRCICSKVSHFHIIQYSRSNCQRPCISTEFYHNRYCELSCNLHAYKWAVWRVTEILNYRIFSSLGFHAFISKMFHRQTEHRSEIPMTTIASFDMNMHLPTAMPRISVGKSSWSPTTRPFCVFVRPQSYRTQHHVLREQSKPFRCT